MCKSTHGCHGQSQLGLPQSAAQHLSSSSLNAEAGHQDLQPLRAEIQWAYSKKADKTFDPILHKPSLMFSPAKMMWCKQ